MKRFAFLVALMVGIGIILLANSTTTFAQGETGSVTGVVSDPQGGTVAGADVSLTDIGTKVSRTTTSNEAGIYHFAGVHVGEYDVTISKQGFKVFKAASQKVSIGTQLTLNVTLEIGSLTETVVVTSQAGSELQTANSTVGMTLGLKELEAFPNLSRDVSSLLALSPGVTPRGDVAGAYMDQSTFSIDGGNNSDDMAGNTIGYIRNFTGTGGTQLSGMASGVVFTPIESVEEFRVNTFGQTSDFNASSGAEVKMVTKRGNDKYHGSGYGFYFAPNLWGANTWARNHTSSNKGIPKLDPATGKLKVCSAGTTLRKGDDNCTLPYTPILPSHRERFGFSFGGPMIPVKFLGGKTYVFVNYEGFRFANVGNFTRSYPTKAMRAGVIQVQNTSSSAITVQGVSYPAGAWIPYNLNPNPVTVEVGNPNSAVSPVRTVTLPSALCGTAGNLPCDPRNIGLNPVVNQIFGFLPLPNSPTSGDGFNLQGFVGSLGSPITSNNYVGRIDHDFGPKHHFFTSFRASKLLEQPSGTQVDVGGILGGTKGQYFNAATRPQLGELWVIGLTSSLSPTLTNDLRLSYLWNWWQWGTAGGPPQLPGLGGAVEIAPGSGSASSESAGALIPYNIDSQDVRQRVWDGQDKMIRDDLSWIKGNHLIQFGALFQRNYMFHNRSDNGVGVNNQITYQVGAGSIDWSSPNFLPASVTTIGSTATTNYSRLASEVLGFVSLPQVAYARTGSDLKLQPVGASAFDQSLVKTYNVYAADTWKIKPTVTINYGLGYTFETPPVEKNGKQVALVYQDGTLVDTADYLAKRKAAALAGQVYNPIVGFENTGNLGIKYPYHPFKKGFSPRFAIAWNPHYKSGIMGHLLGDGDTVIRGGAGIAYGRLNGVNLVLVPLLGVGLLQAVSCPNNRMDGQCVASSVNPSNVFRIGTDGLVAPLPAASATLPQPFFTGGSNPIAQDATVLDPSYKPEKTYSVNFTIQRRLGRHMQLEVGYMGRKINNVFAEISLDSVPYMTTLGGQQFKDAWGNLWRALCSPGRAGGCTQITNATAAGTLNALLASVPNQAFFESALGGTGSAYCGALSCTQQLLAQSGVRNFLINNQVSQFWQYMYTTGSSRANGTLGSWTLPRSMISAPLLGGPTNCVTNCQGQATTLNMTTALGYANYNAMFVTLNMRDWHGMSGVTTMTWGRSLGTGEIAQYNSSRTVLDPFNMKASYGPQNFDYKFLLNSAISYQPHSLFGLVDFRSKKGVVGQLLNGWTLAPFFSFTGGVPDTISAANGSSCTGCQSFGEVTPPGGDSSNMDRAVLVSPYTGGNSLFRGIQPTTGAGSNAASSGTDLNQFADPQAILNEYRRCVLGVDTNCGGYISFRDIPYWDLGATVAKDFKFGERINVRASIQFTNLFNHFAPGAPSTTITSPGSWGVITGQATTQRQTEFGLKISF